MNKISPRRLSSYPAYFLHHVLEKKRATVVFPFYTPVILFWLVKSPFIPHLASLSAYNHPFLQFDMCIHVWKFSILADTVS